MNKTLMGNAISGCGSALSRVELFVFSSEGADKV
jgi:hypothetical protein